MAVKIQGIHFQWSVNFGLSFSRKFINFRVRFQTSNEVTRLLKLPPGIFLDSKIQELTVLFNKANT